jgi:hypothetical protein
MYQHLQLQDRPKFTQIGIFRFKNKPSGNPGRQPRGIDRLAFESLLRTKLTFLGVESDKMACVLIRVSSEIST